MGEKYFGILKWWERSRDVGKSFFPCFLEGDQQKGKALWRCIVLAVAWNNWKERNDRIFEDKETPREEIWERTTFLASLWASTSKFFRVGCLQLKINGLNLCCSLGGGVHP